MIYARAYYSNKYALNELPHRQATPDTFLVKRKMYH